MPVAMIAACNNSGAEEKYVPSTDAQPFTVSNDTVMPAQGDSASAALNQQQPAQSTVTPVPIPQPATGSASSNLNPPHGQPGHRCDIAVGAPLNSAPKTTQTTTTATAVPVQPTPVLTPSPQPAPSTQPSGGSAKLNPAHGQPGHDCTIPVGAPLKQ